MNPDTRAAVERLADLTNLATIALFVVSFASLISDGEPIAPLWILTAVGAFVTVALYVFAAEPKTSVSQ